jgi:hypothetical protein
MDALLLVKSLTYSSTGLVMVHSLDAMLAMSRALPRGAQESRVGHAASAGAAGVRGWARPSPSSLAASQSRSPHLNLSLLGRHHTTRRAFACTCPWGWVHARVRAQPVRRRRRVRACGAVGEAGGAAAGSVHLPPRAAGACVSCTTHRHLCPPPPPPLTVVPSISSALVIPQSRPRLMLRCPMGK